MKTRLFWLLILFVGVRTAEAQTQTNCPWLSTGSAKTALGGDVTVVAHSANNWDGACRFEHHGTGVRASIEIRVNRVNGHPCPAGSEKIPALGNEAVLCRHMLDGEREDTIAGRVRDAWFEVTMSGVPDAARKQPVEADPNRSSLLERVAEQVAGNLY